MELGTILVFIAIPFWAISFWAVINGRHRLAWVCAAIVACLYAVEITQPTANFFSYFNIVIYSILFCLEFYKDFRQKG